MLEIRTMVDSDIAFAVSMTDHEAWGNAPSDFGRLMALEPDGCFVAREGGKRVGMISTTTYGEYAFMGSLIVRHDRRGRGTGTALMHRAMQYLQERNISCIELDATPEGAPLYRRLGFRDKYLSLRYCRPAEDVSFTEMNPPADGYVDQSVNIITEIDRRLTGLDRLRLLARLYKEFPQWIFADPSASRNGYAAVFPRSGICVNIGPLVAGDDSIAERILDIITRTLADHDICVGVPEAQQAMSSILAARGFLPRQPSLRMYWGQERRYERYLYAIASAEKG